MKTNGKPTMEAFTFISAVYLNVTPMWTVWCRQSTVNMLNSKNIAGKYHFNQLYAIDAYRHYRYTWALSQLRALSNKLCIWSVIRVGPSLVICEVSFGSLQGLGCSKHEKPCKSSMNSITKVTYWPHFLLNAYEERHNTSYRGTADLRFHTCKYSSEATSRCQREKPKTVHTANNKEEKQLPCVSQTLMLVQTKCFFHPFSNSGELCSTSLVLM